MVNVIINWSSLTYAAGEALKASIRVADSQGIPPSDLSWTLFRNGVPIASGSSATVTFQTSSPGLYRLKATAGGVTANSAVSVGGGFEIQASPTPPEVDPTCVYLGALYCDEVTGSGGDTETVPFQLASFTQTIYLLPGTTHISFDLDPNQNQVDDEVVVRTATGNYALKGFPSGLYTEQIGYDYTGGQPVLAAPADGVLRLTIEAFNVHGAVASPFNFRVRVKCWRQGAPIYQYVKCPFSSYPGGNGNRHPKFAALVTEMDIQTDVATSMNRLGSTAVNTYTAPEVTAMPLTVLATDGSPNPVQAPTGMFFTDSNCYAIYEPQADDLPELVAKAVSGQDGLRPFYLTLEEPADPPIIQRIKRLGGKLVVYVAHGALTAGSVIRVRILTSKITDGSNEVVYEVPVVEDVYNNTTDTFQRVGAVAIDLEDFQFSENGLVMFFDVDTSSATPSPLPCDNPDPVWPDDYIYSKVHADAVIFDGACFSNPVAQTTVDTESFPRAGSLTGCHEPVCGPVGLYCYTDVATGSRSVDIRQPLYNPAPYVAYGSNPLDCYGDPLFLREITSGTVYQRIDTHTTDALCGDGYIYEQCGGQTRILTVYPHNTVPHDVINYGSMCWGIWSGTAVAGSTAQVIIGTLGWEVVSAGSVTPVADCNAAECSGTVAGGSSVVYIDTQTNQKLPVRFEGFDIGLPFAAVSQQVTDSGLGNLPRGEKSVTFTTPRVHLFNCIESGQVDFNVGLSEYAKRIVVIRGGQTLKFEIRTGAVERIVTLQAGDQVFVDIGNQVGLLSDRTRNKRTIVRWRPIITLPRQYHAATLTAEGTNQIRALGFTGLTDRSDYVLFRTLPQDIEQPFPNPDNIVTVANGTSEYALVRTRAVGDAIPPLPGNVPWYAGESLVGDLQFKFYTSREDQGAHGEMDVWLTEDGHLPAYFKVDQFRTLFMEGGPLDVLFLLAFTDSDTQDALREGLPILDDRLKAYGILPRYGIILIRPNPNTTAVGDDFYLRADLEATAYWNSAAMGNNFGSPRTGLTTIWSAGTLMNWTPGAARAYVLVTPNAVYDYPPGYYEPTSTVQYDKALAYLTADSVPLYTIVNPEANVPITPFAFFPPSNVPEGYMGLATALGGKNHTIADFRLDPAPIMENIAASVQATSFLIRTGSNITDISRNALRKVFNGTEHHWPYRYVAEDGERITAYEDSGTVTYNGKTYIQVSADPGISASIVNASPTS